MKIKNLAVGYRFKPSDQELILTYLYPLAIRATVNLNHPPPPFDGIIECDLYSPDEPWKRHFKDEVNESELYFFTKQKKKKKNEKGKRVDRSFGNCMWKSQKEEPIVYSTDGESTTIGFDRSFSYKVINHGGGSSSSSSSEAGEWVMHEYRLGRVLADRCGGGIEDYVICCVRKKEGSKKSSSE